MAESNQGKTPERKRAQKTQKDAGEKQQAQQLGRKKRSGRETKSFKYVKLEKERPSLTRDG